MCSESGLTIFEIAWNINEMQGGISEKKMVDSSTYNTIRRTGTPAVARRASQTPITD